VQQPRSGFNFAEETLVGWHSGKADILVNQKSDNAERNYDMAFFMQYEEGLSGEYSGSDVDRNAKAGIAKIDASSLHDGAACPNSSSAYKYHWFTPENASVYCVRTRDAKHYAKIQVIRVDQDGITFDWVYQPERKSSF